MSDATQKFDEDLNQLREHVINYSDFARRQSDRIRRIAERWHRHCNGLVDVDDLAQEVLESVWRAIDSFQPQRNVPLKFWVSKCMRHKLQKRTGRARKLPSVQYRNIEHYGRRDHDAPDDFHATAEQVTRFRRRLAQVVGSVSPRDGALVHGIASGKGIECVRQEVYADYSIDGAIRKSRVAIRRALQVAEQLDD